MTSDQDRGLFEAVVAVASDLELGATLRRIVRAAADVSQAQYAALGVLDGDGRVAQFIHVGMDPAIVATIGETPRGRGILGLLVDRPEPLRLSDLRQHPSSAGFPEGHPPMTSFLGVPVRVRGRVFGNLYLAEKLGGGGFTAEDEEMVTALAAAAAVAIDNARLFEITRLRGQGMRAVAAIDSAGLRGAPTDEVLGMIASEARELTGAMMAAIALPDAEGFVVEIVETHDDFVGPTLVGHSASEGETPPWPGVVEALPLRAPERTLGLLYLVWNAGHRGLDDDERNVAEGFAAQAAVNVVLAEARREQERLTVYEDRDRIARDLHDLVIQRLFATGMHLQGAGRIDGLPDEAAERIARAVDDLDETIREIRQTIFALHEPIDSQSDSVRGRVLREATQSGALLGFAPAVRFVGAVDTLVTPEIAEHLIAVLREVLTNAARHAQAAHVDILVDARADGISLVVTDDGIGLDPSGRRSGLGNIHARAISLGGFSAAERVAADGGTRVTWRVPVT